MPDSVKINLMRQKGFAVPLIILGIVVFIVIIAGAFYLGKTITQKPAGYTCPEREVVSFMAIVGRATPKECKKEFLDWAKVNCPNFKGVLE